MKQLKIETARGQAFTLAEVLITLGIIGVVAAVTLPILMTNVQKKVLNERAINAKYKLTLATDKMKSMGLLQESYASTEDFINEFKKHFKIAKVCDNGNLRDCWPTDTIISYNRSGTIEERSVAELKTGKDILATAPGTIDTTTMGIITGDGTSMILVYSPKCSPLEPAKTYKWSSVNGKPETNTTANCISAIMDINGKNKPNKIGQDVRTLNSFFGYIDRGSSQITKVGYEECEQIKGKLGIEHCYPNNDFFPGVIKSCDSFGLRLASLHNLAALAVSKYGVSNIEYDTTICVGTNNCSAGSVQVDTKTDPDSALSDTTNLLKNLYWVSNVEIYRSNYANAVARYRLQSRRNTSSGSYLYVLSRGNMLGSAICVGD